MTAFWIYLLSGVITALPVMWLFLGAWMGVPVIVTEYLSLAGSCALIVSAHLALFTRRTAIAFASLGSVAIAPFWLVEPIRAMFSGGHSPVLIAIWIAAFLLLALVTHTSMRLHRRGNGPEPAGSGLRRVVMSTSMTFLTVLVALGYWQEKKTERHPSHYMLPNGYVGWVVIHYGVPGAPPVPMREGVLEFDLPQSGVLKTSSVEESGSARDEYSYREADGSLVNLTNTGWGKGGMIWAESSGTYERPNAPDDHTGQFFVGSESQYQAMQNMGEMGDGIVPGDLRGKLR